MGETTTDEAILTAEAMSGVPPFYEIPDALQRTIEKATLIKERMFWLRATRIIKDTVNTVLLRRAVYAESRCYEFENMAGEMALITSGAAEKVRELEAQVDKLKRPKK